MTEPHNLDYLDKLDERQKAASMAEKNCVVTAGAGAGKTTVLASRYIHLVIGEKMPVRSILALTFTRKAAAEMYERIYGELAAQTSPWARLQLDDFQHARIMTLDSFCAEIVRQSAGYFGYSPEFAIDDEKCADLAKGIAYRFVRRNMDKPGIKEMLLSFPFDAVCARLFGDLGASNVTPIALFEKIFSPMRESLKAMVDEKWSAGIRNLASISEEIVDASNGLAAPKADCATAIACSIDFLKTCKAISSEAMSIAPVPECLPAIAALAMRSYGKGDSEQSIKSLAARAREEARNLLDIAEYEAAFPSHYSLLERLDEYALEVSEAKRLADLMDFKDLGACAIHALERREELRSFWKSAFQSIMIDEFQDNNELQKKLLYFLAEKKDRSSKDLPKPADLEEGKLFFVGDEKQSIYRFRGADVAVFKRLSAELSLGDSAAGSSSITLTTNYRSSAKLIGFFNGFFSSVMADGANLEETADFRAAYSGMEPGREALKDEAALFDSKIQYYLVEALPAEEDENEGLDEFDANPDAEKPDAETLGADDSLAFEIAQFVKRAIGTLELRLKKGAATGAAHKKADYADFAILLRTTTHQHRLEKYFRLLDIPFDSESPRSLFRESPANDIYNILAFAQDPENKAAYAAILRSPLCRVSDESFLELMTSGEAPFESIVDSERDTRMLTRAKTFFEALASLSKVATVSDIVDFVWNCGGLRLDILSRPESHSFLEHFDYLYHLAAGIDQNRGGTADFLASLRPYIEGESEKLDIENVPRSGASGVKILTMHKSKGLQFPIVIIPWVENVGSGKRGQGLWEMLPSGLAVDLKPYDKPGAKASNVFYRLAKSLNDEMARAEVKRLLYVASTRAEDHLFFFGKEPKRWDALGDSFQHYLEAFSESRANPEHATSGLVAADASDPSPAALLEKIRLSRRTIADVRLWRKRRANPPTGEFAQAYATAGTLGRVFPRRYLSVTEINEAWYALSGERLEEVVAANAAAPIQADKFGTLCHHAVEYAIAFGGMTGYEPPETLLRGEDPEKASRAVTLANAMALNFLESDFWLSLPAQAGKKSEKPFLLALGDYIVKGRMDLFIETETEVLIIDFKSDLSQNPARYSAQMALYREAAKGIIPVKNIKTGLFWLRSSTLAWVDGIMTPTALLDAARTAARSIGHEDA